MATNWPPAAGTFPAWPPPEFGAAWLSFADRPTAEAFLSAYGFTWRNPTTQENNDYFKNGRCDEGHPINGFMIISPDGLRAYPFAYCTSASHRALMALWPPYDCGSLSA